MGSFRKVLGKLATIMSSKQSHQQLKKYLDVSANLKKYLVQCVSCQNQGYDSDMLERRNEKLARENVKKHFKPLHLNEHSLCENCAQKRNTNKA